MMKRLLLYLGLALALTLPLWAEIGGTNAIFVTSASATTTFSTPKSSVRIINNTASANEIYARVFWCGEASAAATTSSPILLEPSESAGFTYNANTERLGGLPTRGYCAVSYVCAAAETATIRLIIK